MRASALFRLVVASLVVAPSVLHASQDPVERALRDYRTVRAQLEAAINERRAAEGLEPVSAEPKLARAAQEVALAISRRLEAETRFAEAVRDEELAERLAAAGYRAHAYGASVAVTPGGPPEVAARLMAAGRGELRRADLPDLGIGIVPSFRSRIYVVVMAQSAAGHFAAATAGLRDLDDVRARLLERVNEARLEAGRGRVEPDACLAQVAQAYAERMLAGGFFSHSAPGGEEAADRVRAGGCPHRQVGENLAKGQTRVEDVVNEWLTSEDHRRVLLEPRYDAMGLGLALGSGPDGYHAVWVQLFGARPE